MGGRQSHLTETCDDDLPHLITHVETTIGPAADGAATPRIHAALQQRGCFPAPISWTPAFLTPNSGRESGALRRGSAGTHPPRLSLASPRGAGFDAQHFQIDWDRQHATCPAGKTSMSWTPAVDNRGNAVIKVKFSTKDCRRCDHMSACVYARRSATPGGRSPSGPSRNIKPSRRPGNGRRRRRFRRSMRAAPGLKARSRAGYGVRACDGRATSACTGASGPHPDGGGAERTAARRVVPGDRAGQDPHHAVCPADGGCAAA